jgi:dephospho-CoA kinase
VLKLKKVAVTGGIASGKTTVCRLFEELGAYYISADEIVHQLLVPSTKIGQSLIALLGTDIVEGKTLSKERIAKKIFCDPCLLNESEKLIHPEVQKVIDTNYKAVSETQTPLFVAEVPLLYEAGFEVFYDSVVVVMSEEDQCLKRSRLPEKEYRQRSKRLMPIEEKIKKADYVIANNGTLKLLRKIIQPIFFALKENV